MDERLRASDHDRERAVKKLEEHYVQGRLDKDEFDERTRAALTAKWLGDLHALTRDLPPDPAPASPAPPAPAIPEPPLLPQSMLTWLGIAATVVTLAVVILSVGLFENVGHLVVNIVHEVGHIFSHLSIFVPASLRNLRVRGPAQPEAVSS
ncbi:MAG: DUF1707 SHOCT-like domain-containing protein [Micromonosporaceae bacterium]